jgi:hypothetical protein
MRPSNPFSLKHFVVEICPGMCALNVREETPSNLLSEPIISPVTTEMSAATSITFPPSLQLGYKRGTQKDRMSKPIECKYFANPREEYISASWEFCVKKEVDGFKLNPLLLPGVKFLVDTDSWQSVCVTIACYYVKQSTPWPWKGRANVDWRHFCHETRIVLPVMDWCNLEKLHRLTLPVMAPTEISPYLVEDYEHDIQKLLFRTSAECKAFVPHKSWDNQGGRGGGAQINSM